MAYGGNRNPTVMMPATAYARRLRRRPPTSNCSTSGSTSTGGPAPEPYERLVNGFRIWWVVAIYTIAMAAVGFHLRHGVWAALTTLGANVSSVARRRLNLLIVGHTARPTVGRELAAQHATDWHLAAHQAIAVEQTLEEHNVAPLRVGVVSYASQQPLQDGTSPANARVEIFLLPPDPPAN